jgi:uncharacterized protein
MNASPANKPPDQPANEPSMEDILASIRRIIADDKMLPLTPKASVAEEAEPLQVEEAKAARESERAPAPAAERLQTFEAPSLRVLQGGLPKIDPQIAIEPDDAAIEEEPVAELPPRVLPKMETSFERAAQALEEELAQEPLISANTDASVSSSFQTLAKTVFLQNSSMVEESVRSMLRPMLKQWLDQNLPPIVERLVRGEIERVARGGR